MNRYNADNGFTGHDCATCSKEKCDDKWYKLHGGTRCHQNYRSKWCDNCLGFHGYRMGIGIYCSIKRQTFKEYQYDCKEWDLAK